MRPAVESLLPMYASATLVEAAAFRRYRREEPGIPFPLEDYAAFALLSIATAVLGSFLVSGLVTGSMEERIINQLLALVGPRDRHIRQVARTAAAPLPPEEAPPDSSPIPVPASPVAPGQTPVRTGLSAPVGRPTPTGTPAGGCYYNACPD